MQAKARVFLHGPVHMYRTMPSNIQLSGVPSNKHSLRPHCSPFLRACTHDHAQATHYKSGRRRSVVSYYKGITCIDECVFCAYFSDAGRGFRVCAYKPGYRPGALPSTVARMAHTWARARTHKPKSCDPARFYHADSCTRMHTLSCDNSRTFS